MFPAKRTIAIIFIIWAAVLIVGTLVKQSYMRRMPVVRVQVKEQPKPFAFAEQIGVVEHYILFALLTIFGLFIVHFYRPRRS